MANPLDEVRNVYRHHLEEIRNDIRLLNGYIDDAIDNEDKDLETRLRTEVAPLEAAVNAMERSALIVKLQ